MSKEEDDFDLRGQQLVEVENQFLDGDYDEGLFIQRIEQYKLIIGFGMLNMGRTLVVMKENCGHGNWLPLLDRMNLDHSTAQKAMNVAAKFNSPGLQKLINSFKNQKGLPSKLIALALENNDDLENLANGGSIAGLNYDDIDSMSASEVRRELRKSREAAEADKEANDRLLIEKNAHADELSKKLNAAIGMTDAERWQEQQAVFDKDLSAFSMDAEELLNAVHSIILSVNVPIAGDKQSISARKSMAAHSVNRINVLAAKLGQIQHDLFAEFNDFIDEPTYSISDDLFVIEDGD